MELAIKNKWISFGGSSTVQTMDGEDYLKVKGKIFTFTKKKEVQDLEGNLIYTVRNKFFSLFGRSGFVFDAEGKQVALVKRKIISLHDRYFITTDLGEMEIIGNILQFNYKIILNGEEVGHIARKFSLRDSFVLTIDDKYDPKLFVAFVIAIDNITDRREENNSSSYSSSSSN